MNHGRISHFQDLAVILSRSWNVLHSHAQLWPGSKFWPEFFYDNGISVEKKRETAGISYKNNGGYRVS